MIDSLYIAWRYVSFHKVKTLILFASITLIVFVPAGLNVLVNESAEQLRNRAVTTPLIVGAKGSDVDLVLNSLYFESDPPSATNMGEADRVHQTGFADAIPLYVRFKAKGRPIVGTTLDYFDFRGLRIHTGRKFAMLGECVLGSQAAADLKVTPGDTLLSSPENVFDLAGVYPLKMHVVGALAPTGTPDDSAVIVDVKTAWIIEGLGHGHQDLTKPEASENILASEGNRVTANAAVLNYTEITPENIDSFHFHGNTSDFPVTAVIALPRDVKAKTLLMGRYQSTDSLTQIVRPDVVMDSLLATILRVRAFLIAGALLLGIATILSIVLVFMLSLRIRRRELETMAKLGCSRFRIVSLVGCEIVLVIGVSVGIAASLTVMTRHFGEDAIRWFLL
jgi:putative ABC transport system permease protein